MSLRQTTRDILSLVESKSGIPVRVTQDPKLPTIAAVRMARKGGSPVHLVLYKPFPGQSPDYQICFECTYILRLFSNPPEKRFDITSTEQATKEVEEMMNAPDGVGAKYGLKKSQIGDLRDQFLNGLVTHLRSIPVGLRVSEWLATNYPELEPLEGLNWLHTELPDYWSSREWIALTLEYLARLRFMTAMEHWQADGQAAQLLAGAVRNKHV